VASGCGNSITRSGASGPDKRDEAEDAHDHHDHQRPQVAAAEAHQRAKPQLPASAMP
jgi:hypothetical protein